MFKSKSKLKSFVALLLICTILILNPSGGTLQIPSASLIDNETLVMAEPDEFSTSPASLEISPASIDVPLIIDGTGQADSPFIIYNSDQLMEIVTSIYDGALINSVDPASAYYILDADIDMSLNTTFLGIGTLDNPFQGSFNGMDHSVNLQINATAENNVGLFRYTNGALVENLTITGIVKGKEYTGSIVGSASNTQILNITNMANVSGGNYTGGLAGQALASTLIQDSLNNGVISGNGSYVGGIAGYASGSNIQRAVNIANVSGGSGYNYTGGIAGYIESSSAIWDSSVTEDVSVAGYYRTGGVAGYVNASTIRNTTSAAKINSNYYVGGIAGYLNGSASLVEACVFSGQLLRSATNEGAIVGDFIGGTINNCTADIASTPVGTIFAGSVSNGAVITGSSYLIKSRITPPNSTILFGGIAVDESYIERGEDGGFIFSVPVAKTVNGDIINNSPGTISFQADGYKSVSIFLSENNAKQKYSLYLGEITLNEDQIASSISGSGFTSDPFVIDTAEKLSYISDVISLDEQLKGVNSSTASYILDADIDMSPNAAFFGIGTPVYPFKGSFNGANHSIKLGINTTIESNVGLFRYTNGAEIENLTITGNVKAKEYVGSVVGSASNTQIHNVTNSVSVSGGNYTGGIVGQALESSRIKDCTNNGVVTGDGSYVGGIAGYTSGSTIQNVENNASVNGSGGYYYTGGIAGYIDSSSAILDSNVTDTVTVTGYYRTAGIAGYVNASIIRSTASAAKISGYYYVGGIIGSLNGSSSLAEECVFSGQLLRSASNEGAIVGDFTGGTINNCKADIASTPVGAIFAGSVSNGAVITESSYLIKGSVTPPNAMILLDSAAADESLIGRGEGGFIFTVPVTKAANGSIINNSPGTIAFQADGYKSVSIYLSENNAKQKYTLYLGVITLDEDQVASGLKGSGSPSDPFVIDSAEKLSYISDVISLGGQLKGVDSSMASYILDADIDLSFNSAFFGIGTQVYPFKGSFDGVNHSIKLGINTAIESYAGLFRYTNGATIENLAINGSLKAKEYVGSVVGSAINSQILNVTNSASVNGGNYTGGIAGQTLASSLIQDSTNNGVVTGDGSYVGGIAGYTSGSTIQNVVNNSNVNGSSGYYNTGGIAGYIDSSSLILESGVTESVTVTGYYRTGGAVGCANASTIHDTTSAAKISGNYYVGGIIGYLTGSASLADTCVFSGQLLRSASTQGAIVGDFSGGTISNCTADISGTPVGTIFAGSVSNGAIITGSSYLIKGSVTPPNAAILFDGAAVDESTIERMENGGFILSVPVTKAANGAIINNSPGTIAFQAAGCQPISIYLSENNAKQKYTLNLGAITLDEDQISSGISGSGSQSDPFVIDTAEKLAYISDVISLGGNLKGIDSSTACYELGDDIDMSSNAAFFGIGTSTNPFLGKLDGMNYSVKLGIDSTVENNAGLFRYTSGAVIENLAITGSVKAKDNTGSVVGSASNTQILNVTNSASVSGGSYVGGIAGQALASTLIQDTENNGVITGSSSYVGGIVGYTSGSIIQRVTDNANVSGSSGYYNTGGIAGYIDSSTTVLDSSVTDTVTVTGYYRTGGAVGCINASTIRNTTSAAKVSGNYYIGGIIGYLSGAASLSENCVFNGQLLRSASTQGAIVGDFSGGTINNCTADTAGTPVGTIFAGSVSNGAVITGSSYLIKGIVTPSNATILFDSVAVDESSIERSEDSGFVFTVPVTKAANGAIINNSPGTIAFQAEGYKSASIYLSENNAKQKYTLYLGAITLEEDQVASGISGSGSQSDPFVIDTFVKLSYISDVISVDGQLKGVNLASASYILGTDIDLSQNAAFFGIGTLANPFKGSFDGANHSIKLGISSTVENYIGLFRYANGASISNLTITGNIRGKDYTGSVVGSANNTQILSVTNMASISGGNYTGGIAGEVQNSIISHTTVKNNVITGSGQQNTGVIFGRSVASQYDSCGAVMEFETVPGDPGVTLTGFSDISDSEPITVSYSSQFTTVFIPVNQTKNNTVTVSDLTLTRPFYLNRVVSLKLNNQFNYIFAIPRIILIPDHSDVNAEVKAVAAPIGAVLSQGSRMISATVQNADNVTIVVIVSDGASWKLYSDSGLSDELIDKNMKLTYGVNYSYLKVTAQNGIDYQVYTVVITLERIAPQMVSGLTAEAVSLAVQLTWNKSDDSTVTKYNIYRAISPDGVYAKIATVSGINNTAYTDRQITEGVTYYYRVSAADQHDTESQLSGYVQCMPKGDMEAPVVTKIEPSYGYYRENITLLGSAADNVGVVSFKFQYSYDYVNWIDIATVTQRNASGKFEYNFDVSHIDEGNIYIRVIARDLAGNISDPVVSPVVMLTVDRTSPAIPANFSVTPNNGSYRISWSLNTEPDFDYYRLYRKDGDSGTYTLLRDSLLSVSVIDNTVSYGVLYLYKVVAVDKAGNMSEATEPQGGMLLDDTVPPEIISISPASGSILPANPKFSVKASDNLSLHSVTVSYKPQSSQTWIELETIPVSGKEGYAAFIWQTDALTDGNYNIMAVARDSAGLTSNAKIYNYTLKLTQPDKPVLTARPGGWKMDLSWSAASSPDFDCYKLLCKASNMSEYRLVTTTKSNSFTHAPLSPDNTYIYKVEIYDKAGNVTASDEVTAKPLPDDPYPPVANAGFNTTGFIGDPVLFDGGLSRDNDGIASYEWDFGDNTTGSGQSPKHSYEAAGTYTVRLKVKDFYNNEDTDSITVQIYDPDQVGALNLKVVDQASSAPLSGATVFVMFADDSDPCTFMTGSDGTAKIVAQPGHYEIAAYKSGYLPSKKIIEVVQHETKDAAIEIKRGSVVEGDIQVHQLTLPEIQQFGIDVNAPESQHVYQFEVTIGGSSKTFITSGNGGFYIFGDLKHYMLWDFEFFKIYPMTVPVPGHPEIPPVLIFLKIPGTVSYLKDFFTIELSINNMADTGFDIINSSVELNVPDGLTLMDNSNPDFSGIISNMAYTDLGDIPGGYYDSNVPGKYIAWILRGDKAGSYQISAEFNGTLMPFNAPINTAFEANEPLIVKAGSGLKVYMQPEQTAIFGEEYNIPFAISNESDTPVNMLSLTFNSARPALDRGFYTESGFVKLPDNLEFNLQSAEDQSGLPIILGGDTVSIDTLNPGEVVTGVLSTPGFTEAAGLGPEQYIYSISSATVCSMGGDVKVPVIIQPLPPASSGRNVSGSGLGNGMGIIDAATGFLILDNSLVNVYGVNPLPMLAGYISNSIHEGDFGKGFSSNYDIRVKPQSDGSIIVSFTNGNDVKFVNVDMLNGIASGKLTNNKFTVSPTTCRTYKSTAANYTRYVLAKETDGAFTLVDADKNTYRFDPDGVMTAKLDKNDRKTDITRSDNQMRVTEPGGKTITADVTDGVITSVKDEQSSSASLEYNANCQISKIIEAEGSVTQFNYDPQGRLQTITKGIGGSAPVNTYTYDENGRVLTDQDPEGNVTRYNYDDDTLPWRTIITITDPRGNTQKLTADRAGHILSSEDALGNKTVYTYNEYGDMTSIRDALGSSTIYEYDKDGNLLSITDAEGIKQTMSYDSDGNMLSWTNGKAHLTNTYGNDNLLMSSIDERGSGSVFTYNDLGQVKTKTVAGLGTAEYSYSGGRLASQKDFVGSLLNYRYDNAGRLTESIDALGNKTSYAYDKESRLIRTTDAIGGITNFEYDGLGNIVKSTDPRGNSTSYQYDKNSRIIKVTDALAKVYSYAYDSVGNLIKAVNPDGGVFTYEYDKVNRLISQTDAVNAKTAYTYNAVGQVETKTLPNGGVFKYTYYMNGSLKSESDAKGGFSSYAYDQQGNLARMTDPSGNSLWYSYDDSGNLISVTDGEGNVVKSGYDKFSRKVSDTDGNGNVTTYAFDAESRLIELKNALDYKTIYEYNGNGKVTKMTAANNGVTSYEYNPMGHVTTVTNPLGSTVKASYDANGNLLTLTDAYGTVIQTLTYDALNRAVSSKDAFNIETKTEYNEMHRAIKSVDELNAASKFNYDKMGRLTSCSDPQNGMVSFEYNSMGDITKYTDQVGNVRTLRYDLMNRISEETSPWGATKIYGYYDNGALKTMKNGRGTVLEFSYDNANRLTNGAGVSYTYDANGNALAVTNASGSVIREYDVLNRVTKYEDTSGRLIEYAYDSMNNVKTLTYPDGKTVNYGYDLANRLIRVTDYSGRETSYEYNKNDILTKAIYSNGLVETRSYDKMNRLTEKKAVKGENVLMSYTYGYDAKGNITTENDLVGGVSVNLDPSATDMQYGSGNRLTSYNGTVINYDADGNMLNAPASDSFIDLKYDALNQLTQAGSTSYTYDGDGSRVSSVTSGKTTGYLNDTTTGLTNLIAMYKPDGSMVYYVYGLGLISQETVFGGSSADASDSYRAFSFDYRGSTVLMSDKSGAVTSRYAYDPFGKLIGNTGAVETVFLYVGQWGIQADANGLYFMRARYYQPETGRFLTEDTHWNVENMIYGDSPIKISVGNDLLGLNSYTYVPDISAILQSENLYLYCLNNPTNLIDPTGYNPKDGYDFMEQIYKAFPGLLKNVQGYATKYGQRIPDVMNKKVIGEIKYVNYQYLSSQIKGMIEMAKAQSKQFILIVDQNKTTISKPLSSAISAAGGRIIYIAKNASSSFENLVPMFMIDFGPDFYKVRRPGDNFIS